jgi:glycosyltransferase 2 family protein
MQQIRRFLPYVLMAAFAAWCVFSLHGDLAHLSLIQLIGSWDLIVEAALLSMLNYVLRIVRWRAYLARLGHRVPLRFTALTYTAGFAYTVSPGKVGEMVRARYNAPLGIPVSDVAAAFFAERFLDLVAMVALAALLFNASSTYHGTILGGAAGAVCVLLALALLPWASVAASINSANRIPKSIRSVLASVAKALASTRTLLRPGLLVSGFLLGLVAWGLEGAGLALLSGMFPAVHLAPATAVGIYGAAVLIGGLSLLPGGLGSTEAVMTALLASHGYSVGQAVLITLTCRVVTLWLGVLFGWCAIFALRTKTVPAAMPWQ